MVWDYVTDAFDYILEFLTELPSMIAEFFGSMFENMGEVSIIGVILGSVGAGLIYVLRNQMIKPFVENMGAFQAGFWTIVTYLGCFLGGYLMGKHFENTG